MIVIIDLYVGCVYLNNYFESLETDDQEESRKDLTSEDQAQNSYHTYPGFGTDYGIDEEKSPPGALTFSYKLTPTGDGTKLNIAAPVMRLIEKNISPPAIMKYVSHRVLDHHNFKRTRDAGKVHFFGPKKNTTLEGTMWVKLEVAHSMPEAYMPLELITYAKKRKRSASSYYENSSESVSLFFVHEQQETRRSLQEANDPHLYELEIRNALTDFEA
jgi:hypothetical protein